VAGSWASARRIEDHGMGLMNLKKDELTFVDSLAALRSEAGTKAMPAIPSRLPLSQIRFATAVFQPRNIDVAFLASDSHVKSLSEAIKNTESHDLDPVTIWWGGASWYVIDGHHRVEAYRMALTSDSKLRIDNIPVTAFAGTVNEAIRRAAALNSKDKLPMSKTDKLERAWKLVCLDDDWTGDEIRDDTSISIRTIATMRGEKRRLEADPEGGAVLALSWEEVKRALNKELPKDGWEEKLAIEWQKRLVKLFGTKLAQQPEIAARALELYSERLPQELIRQWVEEVRSIVEHNPRLLDEPEF